MFYQLIVRYDEFGAQMKSHAIVYLLFYSGSFACDDSVGRSFKMNSVETVL